MRCPACGKRLHKIQPGEWMCDNGDCPQRGEGTSANPEFYGNTQEEIDDFYRDTAHEEPIHRRIIDPIFVKDAKKFVHKIGVRKGSKYTVAGIEELMRAAGIKVKVTGCALTGFSRFLVDEGFTKLESLLSIGGHVYKQIATMEGSGDPKLVEDIIERCDAEILKDGDAS